MRIYISTPKKKILIDNIFMRNESYEHYDNLILKKKNRLTTSKAKIFGQKNVTSAENKQDLVSRIEYIRGQKKIRNGNRWDLVYIGSVYRWR